MSESNIALIITSVVSILATSFGAFLGHYLSQRSTTKNEQRIFLTKLYSEITSEYFLMIDGRSKRSGIVSVAKQALFLCSEDMKPYLKRLIRSVIYIKDIYHDDLSEFHAAYEAFESFVEKEINEMWSTTTKSKKQKPLYHAPRKPGK